MASKFHRILTRILCVTVLLFSAVVSAGAAEDKSEEARSGVAEASIFGEVAGESFDDPNGRELESEYGLVLYEELRDVDSDALMQSLFDAPQTGDRWHSISLARGERLNIEIVPAEKVDLGQTGIIVMRLVETGEVSISGTEFSELLATFSDPQNRGRWVLDSTDKGQLRIRLILFDIPYENEEDGADIVRPEPKSELDEPGEFEFDESFDVPSSLPDETWLHPDGSRAFSDEELAEINRTQVQRNRVRVGNVDVVDVAVVSAGFTDSWSLISGRAKVIINQGNAVMINSSQPTRFRLVGAVADAPAFASTGPNPPTSTGPFRAELRGERATDSPLRLVFEDTRSRFQADVVAFIAPNGTLPGAAGFAGHTAGGVTGNPRADYTFFVVHANAINTGTVVPHEFGHLFGGGHQQTSPTDSRAYANAHTFTLFGAGYTIMWSGQSGNSIVRFSTPTQQIAPGFGPWLGIAGNTESARDNLRAVASYDDNVANLRRGNHCASHGTAHSGWVGAMHLRLVGSNSVLGSAFDDRLTAGMYASSPYSTAEAIQNMGADNPNSYRAHELTRLFRTLFNRVPDYGGYDFWLDGRWSVYSFADVVSLFFTSPEYTALYGGKTDTQFMTSLYQTGLGRNPDPGGLNWWVGQINLHGREHVVRVFSQTQEARDHQEAMTEVSQLYLGVLEKTPNANGFPTFVNRIENQGWTPADIARQFMTYGNYWTSC